MISHLSFSGIRSQIHSGGPPWISGMVASIVFRSERAAEHPAEARTRPSLRTARRRCGAGRKTPAARCARDASAQGAAGSEGPTGTRAGGRIGRYLSGLLGERLVSQPGPPKAVCAEIPSPTSPGLLRWVAFRRRVPPCSEARDGALYSYLYLYPWRFRSVKRLLRRSLGRSAARYFPVGGGLTPARCLLATFGRACSFGVRGCSDPMTDGVRRVVSRRPGRG